jgi:hypothetical protein
LTLFTTLVLASNWLARKPRAMFDDFVSEIRSMNAGLGLNRSVDEAELALDYLLPWRGSRIARYTRQNDFDKKRYVAKLKLEVGRPWRLAAYTALLTVTLVWASVGPLLWHLTGEVWLAQYLIVFFLLFTTCVGGYFIL